MGRSTGLAFAFVVVVAAACVGATEAVAAPVVSTDCGPVSGRMDGHIAAYLGIPFAVPPVGELRWMPPVGLSEASKCWSGTFNASKYGQGCAQTYTGPSAITGGEDCLFLNVWTTAKAGDDQPVMVYIYGGSLVNGDSSKLQLAPLAATGTVVVSMNYRVHGLGFLALPELSSGDPRGTSGNYGFLDQQESLRWVQRNIRSFGGDPDRVTVFGQSSGGTSILALLASPATRGLAHAAIAMSASPNITTGLPQAYTQNVGFIEAAGCKRGSPAATSACLRALSVKEVFQHLPSAAWGVNALNSQLGMPAVAGGDHYPAYAVVDGVTVQMPPEQALLTGLVDIPLMLGNVAQEPDLAPETVVFNFTDTEWQSFARAKLAPFGKDVADRALQLYAAQAAVNPQKAYDSMVADARVACGVLQLAAAATKGFTSPVYSYVVDYEPSNPVELTPALWYKPRYSFHMLDLIGGIPDWSVYHDFHGRGPVPPAYHPTPRDQEFGDMIRAHWLDLARNGRLTGAGGEWPATSDTPSYPATLATALLNATTTSSEYVRATECAFWKASGVGQGYWWTN